MVSLLKGKAMEENKKIKQTEAIKEFMDSLLKDDACYLDFRLKNLANAVCFLGMASLGELPDNLKQEAIECLQGLSFFHFELQNLKK